MDKNDFKVLAKSYSKEILLDSISNRELSEDEMSAYMEEVKHRGLEKELSDIIKNKENRKHKIKESVKELPKDSLILILVYNIDNYSEEDLNIFRQEIARRGLEKELQDKIEKKEASNIEFRKSVLDDSSDATELFENFNKHIFSEFPHLEQGSNKKTDKQYSVNKIVRVVIFSGATLFFLWKLMRFLSL